MRYTQIHPVLRAICEGVALGFGSMVGVLAFARVLEWALG